MKLKVYRNEVLESLSGHLAARENEIMPSGADGLGWEALVKCDLMYLVEKEQLYRRRGSVGTARRRALVQRIHACFGFTLV